MKDPWSVKASDFLMRFNEAPAKEKVEAEPVEKKRQSPAQSKKAWMTTFGAKPPSRKKGKK